MSVSLGSTNIKEMYLGNTKIKEAYLGNTKVFGGEEEQEQYLKISYNKPLNYLGTMRYEIGYVDVNDSNNIIESHGTEINNDDIIGGDPVPFNPTLYVTLCNKTNGNYFNINSIYPEYSYDKITWISFDENNLKTGIPLTYKQDLYIRSAKPLTSQTGATAISIHSKTIDTSTIYEKDKIEITDDGTGGYISNTVTYQCYKYTRYYWKNNNIFITGGSLIEILGNLNSIINYQNEYPELENSLENLFTYCNDFLYNTKKLILPWISFAYGGGYNGKAAYNAYAFKGMFKNCKYLKNGPKILPAITLSAYCYQSMFENCSSLINAPELPAEFIAQYCYDSMFKGCSSLINAPELPAMYVQTGSYQSMFENCSSLINAPELPATKLNPLCYKSMFENCSSLNKAPSDLPSKTISQESYYNMFKGCNSLLKAPNILCTDFPTYNNYNCFISMFEDCTSLNYISMPFLASGYGNASFTNWVKNVSSNGTFIHNYNYNNIPYGDNYIPNNWKQSKNYLLLTALENNVSISYSTINTIETNIYISYDLITWTKLDPLDNIIINKDEYIYIHNRDISTGEIRFSIHGLTKSFGDIISMNNFNQLNDSVNNNNFESMFENCDLINTPDFGSCTNISSKAFKGMFKNCTYLKNGPKILPSTTLYSECYQSMFENCSSLIEPPKLPANSLLNTNRCYSSMFKGCSSLINAPELPAIQLGSSSYVSMFENCINLKTINLGYCIDDGVSNCFYDWMKNVPSNGKIITYTYDKNNNIFNGWDIVSYLKLSNDGKGESFNYITPQYNTINENIYVSYDGIKWMRWGRFYSIYLYENEKIYVWNKNDYLNNDDSNYITIQSTNSYHSVISGDVTSLINFTQLKDYCFYKLFSNGMIKYIDEYYFEFINYKYKSSNEQIAKKSCFCSMFYNNAYMTFIHNDAMLLEFTEYEEYSCYRMFDNCQQINDVIFNMSENCLIQYHPHCFERMFYYCKNITMVSLPLPKDGIIYESSCSYMYAYCTKLTYFSFDDGCAVTSPYKITELKSSALSSMFYGCSKLNTIRISRYLGNFGSNYTQNWVSGVASSGDFYYNGSDTTRGVNAIPTSWNLHSS